MSLADIPVPKKRRPVLDLADLNELLARTRETAVEALLQADTLSEHVQSLTAPLPGVPAPGSIASLPNSLVSDDRKDVGTLYGMISSVSGVADTAVQKAGDTMSGTLIVDTATTPKVLWKKSGTTVGTIDVNGSMDINLPGDLGVIFQARHSGVTDMFISSSGNAHHRGNLGVGPFADTPEHRLRVNEPEIEYFATNDQNPKSGGRGFHINKIPAASALLENSSVVSYDVDGVPRWESGIDFDTQRIGDGNSDFVPAYDHSAGIRDDGTLANTGADIFRISPASHCTVGQGPKFVMSYAAGSPRDQTEFFLCDAGKNLGGIRLSVFHDNSKAGFVMSQRATTHNRLAFSLANANDASPLWEYGVDVLASSRSNWNVSWRDAKTTSAKSTRFFMEGTNSIIGKFGFNTLAPQATHHLLFSNDATFYDVVQTHWTASFEDQGTAAARANRAINIQSILDASSVVNYLWLSGGLGTTSTRATPTATSAGGSSLGIERTDTVLSLCATPNGTNQGIVRPVQIDATGAVAFHGTAPVAKQTVTGSRGGNAALADLLTKLANKGLITDGTSA